MNNKVKITVDEAIGWLRNHELKTFESFHLAKCGGCAGPVWQQPCVYCGYWPSFDMNAVYLKEYRSQFTKYDRESFLQQWGKCNLLDLLKRCRRNSEYWYLPNLQIWREDIAALWKEAEQFEWPTAQDMWSYVYLENLQTHWGMKVPENGTFLFRMSDNVLDDEDHSVAEITMKDGKVWLMTVLRQGVYRIQDFRSMTREELQDFVDYDPTGQHPEQYYEIVYRR